MLVNMPEQHVEQQNGHHGIKHTGQHNSHHVVQHDKQLPVTITNPFLQLQHPGNQLPGPSHC